MDLVTLLRHLDPWPFLAGIFLIFWVVEMKFGGRARATKQDRMTERLKGYDMAVSEMRESEATKGVPFDE